MAVRQWGAAVLGLQPVVLITLPTSTTGYADLGVPLLDGMLQVACIIILGVEDTHE